jgi:hypothetical protein
VGGYSTIAEAASVSYPCTVYMFNAQNCILGNGKSVNFCVIKPIFSFLSLFLAFFPPSKKFAQHNFVHLIGITCLTPAYNEKPILKRSELGEGKIVILVSFWIVSDRTFKPSCIYFPHF